MEKDLETKANGLFSRRDEEWAMQRDCHSFKQLAQSSALVCSLGSY